MSGRACLCCTLLVCLCTLTAACSPRRVAEVLLLGDHFMLSQDIIYSKGARQRLDVYRPRSAQQPVPVIVFFYGGRWQHGAKAEYRLLGDALTRRGFVAVVPDYRLYPQVRFPAWVEDGARAVRWTRENIGRFGGDPEQIFVIGHSAGAHTVALLALDEHYLRQVEVPPGTVRGLVSLAGPVDTVWTDPDVQALMGPRANWPASYPVNHIDGGEPPLLLLHGAQDEIVSPTNSVQLADRIQERGGCARVIVYPNLGHIKIAIALAVPRLASAPVLDDVAAFVREPTASTCPAPG